MTEQEWAVSLIPLRQHTKLFGVHTASEKLVKTEMRSVNT